MGADQSRDQQGAVRKSEEFTNMCMPGQEFPSISSDGQVELGIELARMPWRLSLSRSGHHCTRVIQAVTMSYQQHAHTRSLTDRFINVLHACFFLYAAKSTILVIRYVCFPAKAEPGTRLLLWSSNGNSTSGRRQNCQTQVDFY
jgi:hypothetical protein